MGTQSSIFVFCDGPITQKKIKLWTSQNRYVLIFCFRARSQRVELRAKDMGYTKELKGTWWTCWEPIEILIRTKWEHNGNNKNPTSPPSPKRKEPGPLDVCCSPHCEQELPFLTTCVLCHFCPRWTVGPWTMPGYLPFVCLLSVKMWMPCFLWMPPSCDDVLACLSRSWWVRPKDIGIAKARSSTRINYESNGGPNMGMGHCKGTSHVKWGVLAWWVNIYIPFVHPWGEVWRTRKVDSLCSQSVWFCSGEILLQNLGLCVCYMLSMTIKWWKKYLILWKWCLF